MKKRKVLSIILATTMMFGTFSAMNVSAAETNLNTKGSVSDSYDSDLEDFEIPTVDIKKVDINIPSTIFENELEELVYGTEVTFTFGDSTSTKITLDSSNTTSMDVSDESNLLGYRSAGFTVDVTDEYSVALLAIDYISDSIELTFIEFSLDMGFDTLATKSIDYPEVTEVPIAFAKDYVSYSKNEDGTLTATSYLGEVGNLENLFNSSLSFDVEIPEKVYGMTVTSILEGAFSGIMFNENSITLPSTITTIPKYSIGYTPKGIEDIVEDSFGDIFDAPENMDYGLYTMLQTAKDDDTFGIDIQLWGEDAQEQLEHILSTYFAEDVVYEYDELNFVLSINATKAVIEEISEGESDILIMPEYTSLSYELEEMINLMSDEDQVDIRIELSSEDEEYSDYQELADRIIADYFGGTEDYIFVEDEWGFKAIYISANKSQLEAISSESEAYVYLDYPDQVMSFELYKQLFFSADSDTCDLMITALNEAALEDPDVAEENGLTNEVVKRWLRELYGEYFEGLSSEIITIGGSTFLYVKDASKAVINDAVTNAEINLSIEGATAYQFDLTEGLPIEPSKNFTIYGHKGTLAQAYADENSIKFVDVNERYEMGDVNLDGKVNILDATEIQKHLAKLVTLSDQQLKNANTDHNDTVNILDATQIQKYLAKLVDSL